jgi:hypothetical protein
LRTRFNCTRAVVVAHENFLRPDGTEGFDVGKTLGLIAARLPPVRRSSLPYRPATGERSPRGWPVPEQVLPSGTLPLLTGSISAISRPFLRQPPPGTGGAVFHGPDSRSFLTWQQ